MSFWTKLLIGLAAALLVGWIFHGPAGHGRALIDRLENQAQIRVAYTQVPGIDVRMAREPLRRVALLSGPADAFQREGRGEYPGINQRVERIPGMAAIQWADERAAFALPLLVEVLLAAAIAYLAGLGIGRWLFGRRRKRSYLD